MAEAAYSEVRRVTSATIKSATINLRFGLGGTEMSSPLELSADEQQWLLILEAGGSLVPVPAEIAKSLSNKRLVSQSGDDWSLTDAGIAEAARVVAISFQLNTPPPASA